MFDDIFLFVQVVQNGSFTTVAKMENTHATTISRRLKNLEDLLGYKLYQINSANKLILSEKGKKLYAMFDKLKDESEESLKSFITDDRIEGPLSVVISPILQRLIIDQDFIDLLRKYPNLDLPILNAYYGENGDKLDFDIGLSFQVPAIAHYTQQKMCSVACGFFASTEYIKEYGMPLSPEDAEVNHLFVGILLEHKFRVSEVVLIDKDKNEKVVKINNSLCTGTSFESGAIIASKNMGLVALPVNTVYVNLERVLPEYKIIFELPVYLVQSSRSTSAKKKLILAFLKSKMSKLSEGS